MGIVTYDPQRQYNDFNHLYFAGELPFVPVLWSTNLPQGSLASSHFHGVTRCVAKYCGPKCVSSFILLNAALAILEWDAVTSGSLLHEMAHARCLLGDRRFATHGPIWKKEMNRLWNMGALLDTI